MFLKYFLKLLPSYGTLESSIRKAAIDILPSLKEGDSRYRYRELSAS